MVLREAALKMACGSESSQGFGFNYFLLPICATIVANCFLLPLPPSAVCFFKLEISIAGFLGVLISVWSRMQCLPHP